MKLFIGVGAGGLKDNPRLRQVYTKIKRTVSEWDDPVRWTPPPMWHVTVLFLGQRSPEEFERAKAIMEAWNPPTSTSLSFHGLGAFPSALEGRVLWVGVRENKAFFEMQQSLQEEFVAQNLITEPEREYRPHLTLARFRHTRRLQPLISLAAKTDFGTEPINELVLFESIMQGQIPKYIPRHTRKL